MLPRAEISRRRGAVLALSRIEETRSAGGAAAAGGNIAPGRPAADHRADGATGAGGTVFRLAMQPYSAGSSSLAIPQLSVVQAGDGAIGFAGRVLASGPLPGGSARGLALPISGRWAPGGALSLWRDCVDARFERLELANLTLVRRGITLCPPRGRAIARRHGQSGAACGSRPARRGSIWSVRWAAHRSGSRAARSASPTPV